MLGLIFGLIGLVIVLIGTLIQLYLNYFLRDRPAALQQRWAWRLAVVTCLVAVATGIGFWQTHVEDRGEVDRVERAAQERGQQAQKERQAISIKIQDLVTLARDRDPSLTELEALHTVSTELRNLRENAFQLEDELHGLRRYMHFAEFNAFGLTGKAGKGLKETGRIARALEGAYDENEDDNGPNYSPRCDAEGINMFANVVRDFPDFPFSHWALTMCLGKQGNPQWRTHAERAKEILEHTTQIAKHHPHHDEALQQIERLLAEQ